MTASFFSLRLPFHPNSGDIPCSKEKSLNEQLAKTIFIFKSAETTTGMLCVSFPELGPIIRKRKRHLPSESIVNGQYHSTNRPYPRQVSNRFSTVISQGRIKLDAEPYIELNEGHTYQADHDIHSRQQRRGEIMVTQEITVDYERH